MMTPPDLEAGVRSNLTLAKDLIISQPQSWPAGDKNATVEILVPIFQLRRLRPKGI